jgi:hypothetical protein
MVSTLDQDTLAYINSRISMRRLGQVDDIAPMVCFFLSDKASYMTGQVIQVDKLVPISHPPSSPVLGDDGGGREGANVKVIKTSKIATSTNAQQNRF